MPSLKLLARRFRAVTTCFARARPERKSGETGAACRRRALVATTIRPAYYGRDVGAPVAQSGLVWGKSAFWQAQGGRLAAIFRDIGRVVGSGSQVFGKRFSNGLIEATVHATEPRCPAPQYLIAVDLVVRQDGINVGSFKSTHHMLEVGDSKGNRDSARLCQSDDFVRKRIGSEDNHK
jgi:hypothetical protein